MRIAIATVQVPFIRGGAEILVDMLRDELKNEDIRSMLLQFRLSGIREKLW